MDIIKELDYAAPESVDKLFKYIEKIRQENEDEVTDVLSEYKKGLSDPAREAARFEKKRYVCKSVGRKELIA